jgi:RHS repeat-associated protein
VLWLLADHQGTIRDIVDGDGDLRKHLNYDSFGNFGNISEAGYYDRNGDPIEGTSPWGNPEALVDQLFHFQGQEFDKVTGLQNNNARWYDPATGRFLNEDPSGFSGGDPNLYRYVGNSPLNGTDPTGLKTLKPIDTLAAFGIPNAFAKPSKYDWNPTPTMPFVGQDFSKEVLRLRDLPKGTYIKETTDDFGQTLIHAQTRSGEKYAFNPETGVRDRRTLQYVNSHEGQPYALFSDPGVHTDIQVGPSSLSLSIDGATTATGFWGARMVARPVAQVLKNLAVNIYETILESFIPGASYFNGRPKPKDLGEVLPTPHKPRINPNNQQQWQLDEAPSRATYPQQSQLQQANSSLTPRNAHLAGKNHPVTGVPFDAQGYPDFSSVATKTVTIKQLGNYTTDFTDANRAAGLQNTPKDYTWHHHQDGITMQLVPNETHRLTGHTGGVATKKSGG